MNKWLRVILSGASLALAVLMIVFLPEIVGGLTGKHVSWTEIGHQFGQLNWGMVALMAAVWLGSLVAYSVVLTSSLPGLTIPQGLTLNAAGSAVSNLLPFGGAAGVAMTIAMTKGWGFPLRAVVVSTLVSGIWNTLFRFLLPAVGILALVMSGQVLSPTVAKAGWVGGVSILVLVAVVAAALYWDRAAAVLGRVLDALALALPHRFRPARHAVSEALHRLRADTADVLHTRWPGLSIGMVLFLGLQWLIMVLCLQATGAYPGLAASVAVFALSRVLTSALITPSGAGIMEGGVAALLIAFGQPAGGATTAALLFGFWTYTIEIPWGGLALGGWTLLRKRRQAPVPRAREHAPTP
ncbi:lysylphosphatidylglycerol synthase transmembrane domain-containing protein [Acrocarpospora catenulata]|uniref:lysylphosphatidylglycerol synthase transmembrane domain-containing protein n=1 Tax=Acrocarpospora catenulata TaxID=2836182 RepID=UPI0027E11992|nr:lysylphosphatidylglycerol synthase transmembrane domain-containing protein [Acrocarpospora catenulata]